MCEDFETGSNQKDENQTRAKYSRLIKSTVRGKEHSIENAFGTAYEYKSGGSRTAV